MPPQEPAAAAAPGAARRRGERPPAAPPAGATGEPRGAGLPGLTASTGAARSARLAATETAGLSLHEKERPLVVMVPAEVKTDRFVLALAADAHDAAANSPAADSASLRCSHAARRRPSAGCRRAARRRTPAGLTWLTRGAGLPDLTGRAGRP